MGNRRETKSPSYREAPPPGRLPPVPIPPTPNRYDLSDLEYETGIPARTVRYYISQGLLAPAHGRGPSATYDLGHLLRLRMISILKAQNHPLQDIKSRLNSLSDDDIAALLNVQTKPDEDTWRRIELHPDIELHIRQRAKGGKAVEAAADLIIGLSRPVIERMEHGDE